MLYGGPVVAGGSSDVAVRDKYQGRGRRRRDRTNFSSSTIRLFESVFITERYPDIYLREEMSKKTGVPEERILVKSNIFQSLACADSTLLK